MRYFEKIGENPGYLWEFGGIAHAAQGFSKMMFLATQFFLEIFGFLS